MGEVSVCDVCVHVAPPTSSALTSSPCNASYIALCLGVVMGRFVPLPFFWGRTSTPEEEVKEEEDEEEEELLPSSEAADSRCRWTNHDLRKTQIPQSVHPPPVSIPNRSGQERLRRRMHSRCRPPLPLSK